ncbi:MAG TPA: DUF559 domain-containing protein [Rhodanobacter sp.]|nr:DUF559 domain-containing protein [Rhodanobacter sp.]
MPSSIKPPLPTRTRQNARDLRHSGTDAERKLWYQLRAGRLNGMKFRRQHPIPPYIVGSIARRESWWWRLMVHGTTRKPTGSALGFSRGKV